MSTRIESLVVELVANTRGYASELMKSQRTTESFARRVKTEFRNTSLAITATAGAITAMAVSAIRSSDEIAKNAKVAGLGVETYQAWEYAASQAGVANEQFSTAMQRVTRRIGQAAQGTGEAKKVLDQFGISVFDQEGKIRSTESVLREFADNFAGLESQAQKSAAAMALFDSEGVKLSFLLDQGSDALDSFTERARQLGIIVSADIIRQSELANEQFDTMARIVKANTITALAKLNPVITGIANSFIQATPKVIEFTNAIYNLATNSEQAQLSRRISQYQGEIDKFREAVANANDPSFFDKINQEGLITALLFGDEIDSELQSNIPKWEAAIRARETLIAESREKLQKLLEEKSSKELELLEPPDLTGGGVTQDDDEAKFKLSRAAALHTQALMDEEQREIEQNQKIIDLQQERFNRIHEMALQAAGRDADVERLRFEQEQTKLQEDLDRMRERGLLTQEIEEQFRTAREEAEAIHQAKLTEISKEEAEKRIEVEREIRDAKFQIAEDALAIGVALAKEDSKAQRALLATQKAAALAKSLIALQEAIAKANALGFPANIPAIAQATAIGASAISTIRSIDVQGVAHSGMSSIPREGTYLLNQGERVVAPSQNEDLTQFLRGGGGGGVTVIVNEAPGGNVATQVSQSRDDNGRLMVMVDQRVRQVVERDVASGRGLAGTLQQTYGLSRRGTS